MLQFQQATEQIVDSNADRAKILQDLKQRLETHGLDVSIDEEHGVLRLPEEILFDSAKATLNSSGLAAVGTVGAVVADVVRCYVERPGFVRPDFCPVNLTRIDGIYVEGHTDNVDYTGRFGDNWGLSAARAINTYKAMTDESPELESYVNGESQPVLSVSGYGERRPVVDNSTDELRRQNRRIDLRFIMASPKPEELKAIEEEINNG